MITTSQSEARLQKKPKKKKRTAFLDSVPSARVMTKLKVLRENEHVATRDTDFLFRKFDNKHEENSCEPTTSEQRKDVKQKDDKGTAAES